MTLRTQFTLLGVLCGVLLVAQSCEQQTPWEKYNAAGVKAYEQAHYAEAERHWKIALKEAETFGPQDPRLATSLTNLALLYHHQGRYAEAEPLHQRALAILEKALGPEHPLVVRGLENYAALLRETNRSGEAKKLETRAKAIRAKHAQQSVVQ